MEHEKKQQKKFVFLPKFNAFIVVIERKDFSAKMNDSMRSFDAVSVPTDD